MLNLEIKRPSATHFAPANIALIKYWGKKDEKLNLPTHSSLSLSLGNLGTRCTLFWDEDLLSDFLSINGRSLTSSDPMLLRASKFLKPFAPISKGAFRVVTENSIPTHAGLASSASSYAALTLCLNDLFDWKLDAKELSKIARLGSGSASRSFYKGFALWNAGNAANGSDCYATPIKVKWSELRWFVALVSEEPKAISSREAMNITKQTCPWFYAWVDQAKHDLQKGLEAIEKKDFNLLSSCVESSSFSMHATMLCSTPPIIYWSPKTLDLIHLVRSFRFDKGLDCCFTTDAGPNVKILYHVRHEEILKELLHDQKGIWINPWN